MVIAGLCAVSILTGIMWSSIARPYTVDAPKKIYFYHLHHLGPHGAVERSTWEAVAIDSSSVVRALPHELAPLAQQPLSGAVKLAVFPVSRFMQVRASYQDPQ